MSTLLEQVRRRIADDERDTQEEYRELIRLASEGVAVVDVAAAFFQKHPAYSVEAFDREVSEIIAARELKQEREQAAAKLKSFDHRAAAKAVATAEKNLAELDMEREQWLTAFLARRAEAEAKLAAAREHADEPERLKTWLRMTAPAEKRARQQQLQSLIADSESRIAMAKRTIESYRGIAEQRLLEPNETVRFDTGERWTADQANANRNHFRAQIEKLKGEIANIEGGLRLYREEASNLPSELLVA